MSVTRDISKVILAVKDCTVISCTTAGAGWWSTGLLGAVYVTTAAFSSGQTTTTCGITGNVIDRLGPELGSNFQRADVYAWAYSTRGSTGAGAENQIALGVILQQATASGGTFVDLSTENWPGMRQIFSCALTTPMYAWSTQIGLDQVPTYPYSVDIRAAKRFLRVTILTHPNNVTTSAIGFGEGYHVGGAIAFREGDYIPFKANTTGWGSTSTSTST